MLYKEAVREDLLTQLLELTSSDIGSTYDTSCIFREDGVQ